MDDSPIPPFGELPAEHSSPVLRERRRAFYDRVLSLAPSNPPDDLRKLCDAWKDVTHAKWTWLWLFHPSDNGEDGRWELTSVDSEASVNGYVLGNLTPTEGGKTVAALAAKLAQPILVPDITTWIHKCGNAEYRVVCSGELLAMGCNSILCVPLLARKDIADGTPTPMSQFSRPLKAVVCAHFEGLPPKELEGTTPLIMMGKLSAAYIANAFEAEQHRIIAQMNSMAVEFLTRKSTRRAADDRREYLEKVIELVGDRLGIQYASVFYRSASKKFVYCVATNSLYDSDGAALGDEERLFRNATYRKNEGLTGTVYASGKPFFSALGHAPKRLRYKFRETPLDTPEDQLAWVIYPIYAQQGIDARNSKPEVLGVIRCIGNQGLLAKTKPRNIDPLQIQTLDFIVRMLAPVLETMASNIERERVISIIKHDLFAPLKMARDLIRKATRRLEANKSLPDHFLPDLQFCIHNARTLAAGLDQAPTEVRDYAPRPTRMEADIVAGIKNMLTPHAMIENNMKISTGDIKTAFPEYINIDRDLISRALCNLILNAVKYGESGSVISILARAKESENPFQSDAGYYLLVQNKGEPIADNEKDRIFEEGYRSESAIAKKFGLGMGLPIAKAIMRKHGGDLTLSTSADYTTFSMFFPSVLKC